MEFGAQLSKSGVEFGAQLSKSGVEFGSQLSKSGVEFGSELSKSRVELGAEFGTQLSQSGMEVAPEDPLETFDVLPEGDVGVGRRNERHERVPFLLAERGPRCGVECEPLRFGRGHGAVSLGWAQRFPLGRRRICVRHARSLRNLGSERSRSPAPSAACGENGRGGTRRRHAACSVQRAPSSVWPAGLSGRRAGSRPRTLRG